MNSEELKAQLLQSYRSMAGHIILEKWDSVGELSSVIYSICSDLEKETNVNNTPVEWKPK